MRTSNYEIMIANTPLRESDPFLVIVDDDPDDLEMIAEVYAELNAGERVRTLGSGEALVELLEASPDPSHLPSLIVLDYNMPRLSGATLLLLLKGDPRYRHIPVAMYSTTLSPDIEKELTEAGAIFCRQKPTTEASVRQLLVEFLSLADLFHESP